MVDSDGGELGDVPAVGDHLPCEVGQGRLEEGGENAAHLGPGGVGRDGAGGDLLGAEVLHEYA